MKGVTKEENTLSSGFLLIVGEVSPEAPGKARAIGP
jgi:hypothetical protein